MPKIDKEMEQFRKDLPTSTAAMKCDAFATVHTLAQIEARKRGRFAARRSPTQGLDDDQAGHTDACRAEGDQLGLPDARERSLTGSVAARSAHSRGRAKVPVNGGISG